MHPCEEKKMVARTFCSSLVFLHSFDKIRKLTIISLSYGIILSNFCALQDIAFFQIKVFSRFHYVLLCNLQLVYGSGNGYIHDYITRRNKTERKLLLETAHSISLKFYKKIYVKGTKSNQEAQSL